MKGLENMAATLRLSTKEQELIREKCIKINKILIKNGNQPIKDSELAHTVLELALKLIEVDSDGNIFIE